MMATFGFPIVMLLAILLSSVAWLSVHHPVKRNPARRPRQSAATHLPGITSTGRWPSLLVENRLPRLVGVLALTMVVVFCIWLVAIYIGDEYVRPSWDSNSVPAERLY